MYREPTGVSVVIPVFNGARFLDQALDSVQQQDYAPVEILVIDDGSTDDTASIAAHRPNVRYLRQSNQGNASAKNLGISNATYPLVAFLDVDDLWMPHKLATQVAHLEARPELGFVLCHAAPILEDSLPWPEHLNQAHWQSNPALYAPSALLAHRHLFDQVGLFDTDYWRANDSDWFLRAATSKVPMTVVDDVLVYKRIHPQNLTHDAAPMTAELLQALRAKVARQR
ncbi:MAG: glycosyltransferase family 2 protein [Caldilineaceae bacterium]|nr:glycosyltransferase family 2 protein [Caldilineaceae bacterium]